MLEVTDCPSCKNVQALPFVKCPQCGVHAEAYIGVMKKKQEVLKKERLENFKTGNKPLSHQMPNHRKIANANTFGERNDNFLKVTDSAATNIESTHDQMLLRKIWDSITSGERRRPFNVGKLFFRRMDIGREMINGIEGDYFVGASVFRYEQWSQDSIYKPEIIFLSHGSTPDRACHTGWFHHAIWLDRVNNKQSAIELICHIASRHTCYPRYMPADTRGLVFFRAQWEEWFEQTDRVIENHPLVVHDDTNDKLKVAGQL